MATLVTGLFATASNASAAAHTLEARGVKQSQICVVAGESVSPDAFAIETHSKLPEGAAIGAGTGGAIGALVAGFTAVGAIATGGAGLVAAGPMIAALAGAGAGAAGGSIIGGGIGLAIPEHEVKHYQDALERGSVLLGIEAEDDDQRDMVEETFKHFDAERISTA